MWDAVPPPSKANRFVYRKIVAVSGTVATTIMLASAAPAR
jgi:hypothetical protein